MKTDKVITVRDVATNTIELNFLKPDYAEWSKAYVLSAEDAVRMALNILGLVGSDYLMSVSHE